MNGFLIGDAVTGASLLSVALRPAMGIAGLGGGSISGGDGAGSEKVAAGATAAFVFAFLHRANEASGVAAGLYKANSTIAQSPVDVFFPSGADTGGESNGKLTNKDDSSKKIKGGASPVPAGSPLTPPPAADKDEVDAFWWDVVPRAAAKEAPAAFFEALSRSALPTAANNTVASKKSKGAEEAAAQTVKRIVVSPRPDLYEEDADGAGVGPLQSFPSNASAVPRFSQTGADGQQLTMHLYLHPWLPVFCVAVDSHGVGGYDDDEEEGEKYDDEVVNEEKRVNSASGKDNYVHCSGRQQRPPAVGAYVAAAMANLFVRHHGALVLRSLLKSQPPKPADLKAAKKAILPFMKAVYRRAVRGAIVGGFEEVLSGLTVRPIPSDAYGIDENVCRCASSVSSFPPQRRPLRLVVAHDGAGSLRPPGAPASADRFHPQQPAVDAFRSAQRRQQQQQQQHGGNNGSHALTPLLCERCGKPPRNTDRKKEGGVRAAKEAEQQSPSPRDEVSFPIHLLSSSLILVNFEPPSSRSGAGAYHASGSAAAAKEAEKAMKEAEKRRRKDEEKAAKKAGGGKGATAAASASSSLVPAKEKKELKGIAGLFFISPPPPQSPNSQGGPSFAVNANNDGRAPRLTPAPSTSQLWAMAEGRRMRQQLLIGARIDAKHSLHRGAGVVHHHAALLMQQGRIAPGHSADPRPALSGTPPPPPPRISSFGGNGLGAEGKGKGLGGEANSGGGGGTAASTTLDIRIIPLAMMHPSASSPSDIGGGAGNTDVPSTAVFPPPSPFIHTVASAHTCLGFMRDQQERPCYHTYANPPEGRGGPAAACRHAAESLHTATAMACAGAASHSHSAAAGSGPFAFSSGGTAASAASASATGSPYPLSPSSAGTLAFGGGGAVGGGGDYVLIDGVAVSSAIASVFEAVAFPKVTVTRQADLIGPHSVGGGADETIGAAATRVSANAAEASGAVPARPSRQQLALEKQLGFGSSHPLTSTCTNTAVAAAEEGASSAPSAADGSPQQKQKASGSGPSTPPPSPPPISHRPLPRDDYPFAGVAPPTTLLLRTVVAIAFSPVFTVSLRLAFRAIVATASDGADGGGPYPTVAEASAFIDDAVKAIADGVVARGGSLWRPCLRTLYENDIPLF